MKDTYRERIKEEQKNVKPQQVFFQKAINGFSSILQMKWQGKSWSSCFCTRTLQMGLPAGMTERGLASTLIIQSLAVFLELEQKSDSLVGILGTRMWPCQIYGFQASKSLYAENAGGNLVSRCTEARKRGRRERIG